MKYVTKEEMMNELKIYFETGKVTEKLGGALLLIATKYAEKGNFVGYTWKDDMIGESLLTCLKYLHNFKMEIDNPNPFAYFSRIIYNSFISFIAKQKTHSKIKDICYNHLDFLLEETDDPEELFKVCSLDYEAIRGYKKKKKRKRKKKKTEEE